MPQYDFRCDDCRQIFSLKFKTYAAYDAADPRCPACGAEAVSRVIGGVSFAKGDRDYSRMSADEMLSVLEAGDETQVDSMFRQVGDSVAGAQSAAVPKQTAKRNNVSPLAGKSDSNEDN